MQRLNTISSDLPIEIVLLAMQTQLERQITQLEETLNKLKSLDLHHLSQFWQDL